MPHPRKVLVSAGEASGDLYASMLVDELRRRWPEAEFFGATGVRLRESGVRSIIDATELSVVGLIEVLRHIPHIYSLYRRLIEAARRERPDVAIVTDSSGFHLRVAKALHRLGIPVIYLVAPQAWAWRRQRVHKLRRNVARLLCIFPFEEKFFRSYGVRTDYIGHPLAWVCQEVFGLEVSGEETRLEGSRPIVALLPGSRRGEVARHLPLLVETVKRIVQPGRRFILGLPEGFDAGFVRDAFRGMLVEVLTGRTRDLLASCDVALAASGTVTVEGALAGAPMATFYKVAPVTWALGKHLVSVPFYSMVNLVAERKIVAELIQDDATPERLAAEAEALLGDPARRARMKEDLKEVARRLSTGSNPMVKAADLIEEIVNEIHVPDRSNAFAGSGP